MPTQNVSLTTELETFVRSLVESGRFKSVSEVHRAALSELERTQKQSQLQHDLLEKALAEGSADLANGRFATLATEDQLDALFSGISEQTRQRTA